MKTEEPLAGLSGRALRRARSKGQSICDKPPYVWILLDHLAMVAYDAISEMMVIHLAASGHETPTPAREAGEKKER